MLWKSDRVSITFRQSANSRAIECKWPCDGVQIAVRYSANSRTIECKQPYDTVQTAVRYSANSRATDERWSAIVITLDIVTEVAGGVDLY